MDIVNNLKTLSKDFLLIIDPKGKDIEIGDHFKKTLDQRDIPLEEVSRKLQPLLPSLEKSNSFSLPLEQNKIFLSPFSVLYRDPQSVILIAEDMSLIHPENDENYIRIKALLDDSSDPIFGFLSDGTYFYVNNVFARTLDLTTKDIINKKIWDVFPQDEADKRYAIVQKVFETGEIATIEVTIPHEKGDKHFLTTAKPFKDDGDGSVKFVICISKDITELRNAQEQLKTLRGLIPICSNCKNIKDDQGAWQQLEEYISNHSEAQFSHGLCPDCVKTLYPDLSIDT